MEISDQLRKVIERAIEDEKFRALLFNDPDKALKGYKLTAEERQLLENLNPDNFDKFVGGLDDRTTKALWLPGGG